MTKLFFILLILNAYILSNPTKEVSFDKGTKNYLRYSEGEIAIKSGDNIIAIYKKKWNPDFYQEIVSTLKTAIQTTLVNGSEITVTHEVNVETWTQHGVSNCIKYIEIYSR